MNLELVDKILDWLAQQSVGCICLCPGGRNGAFVEALENSSGFEVLTFYDERSAGFFALGRAKRDQKPVAIITTSGTAVTEIMSAIVEADYSGVPLVAITADRPRSLRGTGAPQSIEQKNIFGLYVENCYDIEGDEKISIKWEQKQPLHLNLCFDEPIIDGKWKRKEYKISEVKQKKRQAFSKVQLKKPLLILGGMDSKNSQVVAEAISDWQGPIYAESLSQLKNYPSLKDQQILSGDRFVQKLLKESVVDSVLRIGDVPVGRFWRDLDELNIPITNLSSHRFKGTSKGELFVGDLESIKAETLECEGWDWSEWRALDRIYNSQISQLLEEFPQSEVANYKNLSKQSQSADMVYLGNSLPIRLWDLVADNRSNIQANRGVNGIDGQISTAFGLVKKQSSNWIILGDLTTLYDMSGFWVSPYLQSIEADMKLVVMNNHGGQIFSRMFNSSLFLNSHNLNFKPLAEMWGWDYQQTCDASKLKNISQMELIEINPDSSETQSFWDQYDQLWKK